MAILKDEVAVRQQNDLLRRMKQAKLPRNSDFDNFDFNHSAGITKSQLHQLRELVWLDQMYNLIFMGPSGTGKTYMAAGLVRDAVMKGCTPQYAFRRMLTFCKLPLTKKERTSLSSQFP